MAVGVEEVLEFRNLGEEFAPFVGVTKVTIDDATDSDDWWTLQGIKLMHKPTQPGVYIHRGKKITVRRNNSATAISLKKDK